MPPSIARIGLLVFIASTLIGCREREKFSKTSASSNGSTREAYLPPPQGTGTIAGTVYIEGDPALIIDADTQKIPVDCDIARDMYPPLFREGAGRTLADVFVGVTGYNGKAPPKSGPVSIEAKGCAFPTRTIALSKEQSLRVKSGDGRTYVPELFGAKNKASLVAVPGGDSIPVFHRGPGQYVLVNSMQIFAQATVLVVDYSTFDVTGINGKFRIEGIPVGDAEVSAFLPAAKLNSSQKVKISRGRTTHVDFRLKFDASAFNALRKSSPRSEPSSSAVTPSSPAISPSAATP